MSQGFGLYGIWGSISESTFQPGRSVERHLPLLSLTAQNTEGLVKKNLHTLSVILSSTGIPPTGEPIFQTPYLPYCPSEFLMSMCILANHFPFGWCDKVGSLQMAANVRASPLSNHQAWTHLGCTIHMLFGSAVHTLSTILLIFL